MDYVISTSLGLKFEHSLSLASGDSSLAPYADSVLAVAWWSGIASIAMAMLMLLVIAVLRTRLLERRRRDRITVERWQPVLAQCVEGVPPDLPSLALAERETFLRLWNHYFESLRGAAGAHLIELARRLNMDIYARGLLGRRSTRYRLLAVLTLGHLEDGAAWESLRKLADHPSPLLSLAAARACLEIDADEALDWLIPLVAEREEWPLTRVSTILVEAGPDRITRPLAVAFERTAAGPDPARRIARLRRLVEIAHVEQLLPVVRRVLRSTKDEQIIASCLNLLVEPEDLETVRAYCSHPGWAARMAAARALGRLGTPDDRKRLVDMLADRHWWVRYHAAHALVAMPFVKIDDLKKIRAVLEDRYASDMLGQVIAGHE